MVHNRWWVLLLMFLIRTGVGLQFIGVAALLPVLRQALELNYTQTGLLLGIFMLSAGALALPSGMISNWLGDRVSLLIGLNALMFSALLVAWSGNFWMALPGRLFGGVGAVFITVTASKVLIDWFSGRELGLAMSLLGVTWPIGIGLGMSLLPLLEAAHNWQFAITLTLFVPGACLVLLLFIPLRPEAGSVAEATAAGPTRLWRIQSHEWKGILLAAPAWPLMNGGGYVLFSSYAPGLLMERGMAAAEATQLIGVLSWLFLATIPLSGVLNDRLGWRDRLYWAGCLLPALGVALLPLGGPVLAGVFLCAAMGLTIAPIMSLPGEILAPESRATGLGLYYTVYFFGISALPALGGWVWDLTGSASAPLWFSAGCLTLSPFFLLALRLYQRRQPRPPAA